jgi:hypothetical protein
MLLLDIILRTIVFSAIGFFVVYLIVSFIRDQRKTKKNLLNKNEKNK